MIELTITSVEDPSVIWNVSVTIVHSLRYWTFGSNVDADILSNYDADDPLVLVGLIAMAFKTYTTYPLIIFCGRTGVDSLAFLAWKRWRTRSSGIEAGEKDVDDDTVWESGEKKMRIIQVSVWFFSTLAISMVAPGMNRVMRALFLLVHWISVCNTHCMSLSNDGRVFPRQLMALNY